MLKNEIGRLIAIVVIGILSCSILLASSTEPTEKEEGKMEGSIIKVYTQEIPAMRFIGKKGFGWDAWFQNGWFEVLETLLDDGFKHEYEDWGAYIGLYRFKEDRSTEYYIGMLLPADTPVPTDFEHIDFPKSTLGVGWAYGSILDVHRMSDMASQRLKEDGYTIKHNTNGDNWLFERCGCPRYTEPDEKGNVILDYCFFILSP